MATEAEILTALNALSAGFPEVQLQAQNVQAYCEDLASEDAQTLWEACRRLRRSAKWFPKIREILAECDVVGEFHRYERKALPETTTGPPNEAERAHIQACVDRLKEKLVMP